ncbi:HAD family hydrolase [Heyndrickxia sp. NPDC080065]|uniref:HAD family hydrolase n=1 Tax=Heyndrickxia sp. NPDC080065 TaxID=3390568 RepID=UPI003D038CA4
MIQHILFDVDGVLLSEERYFDASALTVWELLHSDNYLGLGPDKFTTELSNQEISTIREMVFQNDKVLKFFKSRGLNANWDMIYLTFSCQLLHLLSQINGKEHKKVLNWLQKDIDRQTLLEMKDVFAKYDVEVQFDSFFLDFNLCKANGKNLFHYLNILAEKKLGVITTIFNAKSALWSVCEHVSQEWYVGDEYVLSSTGRPSVQTGKKGFLSEEKTLAAPSDIGQLFQDLTDAGMSIGIGTGRPELETIKPFEYLDWINYFDQNKIVTADDVLRAEKEKPSYAPLSKPNPYTYIQASKGKQTPVTSCLNMNLPIENGDQILVVGDSLADLLAARKMGCRFAAVLTGLSGRDARREFEEYNAEFILDSVLKIKELVKAH